MTERPPHTESIERVREMLGDLAATARSEIIRADDAPQARALLEVTAEVLTGLETACRHYQEGEEAAWQGSD